MYVFQTCVLCSQSYNLLVKKDDCSIDGEQKYNKNVKGKHDMIPYTYKYMSFIDYMLSVNHLQTSTFDPLH